jgi:hypothetical protein
MQLNRRGHNKKSLISAAVSITKKPQPPSVGVQHSQRSHAYQQPAVEITVGFNCSGENKNTTVYFSAFLG